MDYAIITPVKNEGRYIGETIKSVTSQTILPKVWIIVNDASTDNTRDIVESFSKDYDFIRLVDRNSHVRRDAGFGGIRAFNEGIGLIDPSSFDFIVNLDGDVSFDAHYFERVFEKFEDNPHLGIAGGQGRCMRSGKLHSERIPKEHIPGYTKIYRTECFEDIAPLREVPSWDTVDELIAHTKGWLTQSYAEIPIVHLKPMALGAGNIIKGKFIQGSVSRRLGYRIDFMTMRAFKMTFEYPYVIGGFLAEAGYIASMLRREPFVIEDELIEELRAMQSARLRSLKTVFQHPSV